MTIAPGSRLGQYEIVSLIGGGGMGLVYKAQDTRLKRPVALKLLPLELTRDETAKQRFLQEARRRQLWTIPTSASSTRSTKPLRASSTS